MFRKKHSELMSEAQRLPFTSYAELTGVLRASLEATRVFYSKVRALLTNATIGFDQLCQAIQQLAGEYTQQAEKRNIECGGQVSVQLDRDELSSLGKSFGDITRNHVLEVPAFARMSETLKMDCLMRIDRDLKEYEERFNAILEELDRLNAEHESALARYQEVHAAYVRAGHALVEKKRAKKAQEVFDKAKSAALQAHAQLKTQLASLSMKMETQLSDYEDLELWRADRMAQFMQAFSDSLVQLSEGFVEWKGGLFSVVHHLPADTNIEAMNDFRAWETAETDDQMQPLRVNPAICKILPVRDLFPEEYNKQMRFYRVKSDFTGKKGFLTVKSGEIVASSDTLRDTEAMCRSINQSVGQLPSCILEPVSR